MRRIITACTVAGLLLAFGVAGAAAAAKDGQTFTLYSVPKLSGFVNNSDDRTRGLGNNPFGNYSNSGSAQTSDEKLLGPFAGDEGLFTYDVYSDAAHKHHAGTGLVLCQYGFAKQASCDVQYSLQDGSLIGVGALNATATGFSFTVTGGTSSYRSMRGEIQASLGGARATPAYLMLEPQRLQVSIRPASTARPIVLGQYSLVKTEQFVDNGDDEVRGYASNPFRIRNKTLQASEDEDKGGPYPGDEAVFSFKVYKTSDLKTPTGTATFTCQYAFNRSAFCDAYYQLAGGTLTGAGAFDFNADTFALAITGGTGKYVGVTGDLGATQSGKLAQRLAFVLRPQQ